MELKLDFQENHVLATPVGIIGEDAGDAFREYLHPIVGQGEKNVILNLSEVKRINSRGIGHLVVLVSDANTNRSRVIMASPTAFVAGVFLVSKLDKFFEMADSVEQAIEKLNPGDDTE